MPRIRIEVCCGSADDVFEAARAGADRVELNSALFLGGLTPSIGQLRVARAAGIEIMAMVRPREGGFCYTEKEFATMLADTEALLEAGADGIAFGILCEDGRLDVKRCERMMQAIGGAQSVFHRAIDVVPNWEEALDTLCAMGVTRVLTSGQMPSVQDGADTVRAMREYAGGRIEILPGGGIRMHNVRQVLHATGCGQIHVSMKTSRRDPSTLQNTSIHFGGALYPPEDSYGVVDAEQLQQLQTLL